LKENKQSNTISSFSYYNNRENLRKNEEKKVWVAVLDPTRYDNSKGTRIGPSLFYASELHSKCIKKAVFETCSLIIY